MYHSFFTDEKMKADRTEHLKKLSNLAKVTQLHKWFLDLNLDLSNSTHFSIKSLILISN